MSGVLTTRRYPKTGQEGSDEKVRGDTVIGGCQRGGSGGSCTVNISCIHGKIYPAQELEWYSSRSGDLVYYNVIINYDIEHVVLDVSQQGASRR